MVVGRDRETPPSFRQRIVGSEATDLVTSDGKQVVRSGATGVTADIDIVSHDLDPNNATGGDFNLVEDRGIEGNALDVGGTQQLAVLIYSESDEPFSVRVSWYGDGGDEVAFVDDDIDPNLLSNTDSNYNHHVAWTTAMFGDRYDLTVTSEVGDGTQNVVSGTINAH